ncbi:hypothetical protein V8E54_010374 [Elaphomyces granulatus]
MPPTGTKLAWIPDSQLWLGSIVTDSSLSSQGDLNDASQLSSTHLPAALESSIPAERDGQLKNIAAETIVQDVQETSRVPLIVGGLGNGILISPYTDEPELDQVSKDILTSWSSQTNIFIPAHQCSWICRAFHIEG